MTRLHSALIAVLAALACRGGGGDDLTVDVIDPLRGEAPVVNVEVRLHRLTPAARAHLAADCRRADSAERALVARQGDEYPRAMNATTLRERAKWQDRWDTDAGRRDSNWAALWADVTAALGPVVAVDTTGPRGRFTLRGVADGQYVATLDGRQGYQTVFDVPDRYSGAHSARLPYIAGQPISVHASRPVLCADLLESTSAP
jgi:hypothetical protein